MSRFLKFNEAARLYAQYSGVVDAMYIEFKRNVDEFLDSLRNEIKDRVVPDRIQEKTTPGYRYWWLADNDLDKDAYPQLWVDSRTPEIVVPGKLTLTACAPRASGEQLRQLADVAKQPVFASFCKPGAGGPWSLFTIIVSYSEEDPVSYAAEPIASILRALKDVAKT